MKINTLALFCLVTMLCAQVATACDLCANFKPTETTLAKRGINIGVFEQFTHFGTVQQDGRKVDNPAGQKLDSSITQFIMGYQVNDRFGVQLNIPYIHRSFKRATDTGIEEGSESGVGDLAVVANVRLYEHLADKSTFILNLLGGVKLPTGSTDRLREEATMDEMEMGAIHGHDLALGSGSYDGIVGTTLYGRWDHLFVTGAVHYMIRSRGDFDYRVADDVLWNVKPGVYLWRTDKTTLGLKMAVSGENKGKDDLNGVIAEDTGMASVFLGPEFSYTWKDSLSAELGAEFPVINDNTALQIVPDYRVRAALAWRF